VKFDEYAKKPRINLERHAVTDGDGKTEVHHKIVQEAEDDDDDDFLSGYLKIVGPCMDAETPAQDPDKPGAAKTPKGRKQKIVPAASGGGGSPPQADKPVKRQTIGAGNGSSGLSLEARHQKELSLSETVLHEVKTFSRQCSDTAQFKAVKVAAVKVILEKISKRTAAALYEVYESCSSPIGLQLESCYSQVSEYQTVLLCYFAKVTDTEHYPVNRFVLAVEDFRKVEASSEYAIKLVPPIPEALFDRAIADAYDEFQPHVWESSTLNKLMLFAIKKFENEEELNREARQAGICILGLKFDARSECVNKSLRVGMARCLSKKVKVVKSDTKREENGKSGDDGIDRVMLKGVMVLTAKLPNTPESTVADHIMTILNASSSPLSELKSSLRAISQDINSTIAKQMKQLHGGQHLTTEAWTVASARSRDEQVVKSYQALKAKIDQCLNSDFAKEWDRCSRELCADRLTTFVSLLKQLRELVAEYKHCSAKASAYIDYDVDACNLKDAIDKSIGYYIDRISSVISALWTSFISSALGLLTKGADCDVSSDAEFTFTIAAAEASCSNADFGNIFLAKDKEDMFTASQSERADITNRVKDLKAVLVLDGEHGRSVNIKRRNMLII